MRSYEITLGSLYDFLVINHIIEENRQGDCHEFFLRLTDILDNERKMIGHAPLFEKLIYGKYTQSVMCLRCSHSNSTSSKFSFVEIHGHSVSDSLDAFLRPERVDGHQCDHCRTKNTSALISKNIEELPPVLVFNRPFKDRNSDWTLNIQLTTTISGPSDTHLYNLYAMINHIGSDGHGHYYCQIQKHPESTVFLLDDNRVTTRSEFAKSNMCTLYYKKGERV